tara:strand:- start:451 stop:768 length:318 start_codon:yes stop_codon:yes gene_type:complete
VVEDVCFEIILEVLFWVAFHVLFETAVQILMGLGFSRLEAEAMGFVFLFAVVIALVAINAYRRKKLGKAVVMDTDGDGRISEEEEAAAFDQENDEDEPGEWWKDD